MSKTITFNKLRKVKDTLPNGSMAKIAGELGLEENFVRNYFGTEKEKNGGSYGFHIEPGPDGGLVVLDDTKILNVAYRIIGENIIDKL